MKADSSVHAAAADAHPHVLVAHCGPDERAPLGLDRALPLLGGGARLSPSGIASTCGMDHLPHFRSTVSQACRDQRLRSADWFWQPPTALVGPEGTGRGLAARWLASEAGLPLFRFDPASLAGPLGDDLWPGERRTPPAPAIAMTASACANPVVLLEIGKMPSEAVDKLLASMMDRRLTARWLDETTGAILDMSHVTWIVQADRLPPHIGATVHGIGVALDVSPPAGVAASLRSLAITAEACRGDDDDPARRAAVFEAVEEARNAGGSRTGPVGCAELCEVASQAAGGRRGWDA